MAVALGMGMDKTNLRIPPTRPNLDLSQPIVTVHSQREVDAATQMTHGSVIVAAQNAITNITLRTTDLMVMGENYGTSILGHVKVQSNCQRAIVGRLCFSQLKTELGCSDIRVENYRIDCPNASGGQPHDLQGERIELFNGWGYGRADCGCIWSEGHSLIDFGVIGGIYNCDGWQSTMRCEGTERGELLETTLRNEKKHTLRLHRASKHWKILWNHFLTCGVAFDPTEGPGNEDFVVKHNVWKCTNELVDVLKISDLNGFDFIGNKINAPWLTKIDIPLSVTVGKRKGNTLNERAID